MNRMPTLRKADIETSLNDPDRKRQLNKIMFEEVAASYNRFTRVSSLGMDMVWKRQLLALVKTHVQPDQQVLDLACGTGDLACAVAKFVPRGHVIGVDLTLSMVQLAERARQQHGLANVNFCVADGTRLPLASNSVDLVTVGYGLRNFPDLRLALQEIRRVLKPGGYLASLDFSRIRNPIWRVAFLRGLLRIGQVCGWLWHGEPEAYGYLSRSIARFVHWQELSEMMRSAGFRVVAERPQLFGAICLHLVQRVSE